MRDVAQDPRQEVAPRRPRAVAQRASSCAAPWCAGSARRARPRRSRRSSPRASARRRAPLRRTASGRAEVPLHAIVQPECPDDQDPGAARRPAARGGWRPGSGRRRSRRAPVRPRRASADAPASAAPSPSAGAPAGLRRTARRAHARCSQRRLAGVVDVDTRMQRGQVTSPDEPRTSCGSRPASQRLPPRDDAVLHRRASARAGPPLHHRPDSLGARPRACDLWTKRSWKACAGSRLRTSTILSVSPDIRGTQQTTGRDLSRRRAPGAAGRARRPPASRARRRTGAAGDGRTPLPGVAGARAAYGRGPGRRRRGGGARRR